MATNLDTLPPRDQWTEGARKLRDTYALTPGAPLVQREFGYFGLERWHQEGLARDASLAQVFGFDEPGLHGLMGLGWCEAAFDPPFEVEVIEERGEHEVVRDVAGRHVLYFKGRRSGFMPHYLSHPVRDQRSWEQDVKWRLDPNSQSRWKGFEHDMANARQAAQRGLVVQQHIIGGYMYLRSLLGPEGLLYATCENPALLHDCMQTWLTLCDAVTARHQEHVTFDEVYLAEDICYVKGPLISLDMMREFLLPYYQQLLTNIRARQRDWSRHLHVQIDTDGFALPVIPFYQEIGMDIMSPFEVAAGCDVVAVAREHPHLVLIGGIDKRGMSH